MTNPTNPTNPTNTADLRAAAQAVVDSWDTPTWKDVPATAEYINRLRAALAAPAQAGWCKDCNPDNCGGCATPAAPAQAGEYPAGTGNPEADRIICRLASSDPDFDDCADAVALIHKLVAEIKGPDGFATWKDAAIADRAAGGAAQAAPVDAENEIDLLAEAALCERLDTCLAAARATQKEAND